MVDVTKPAPGVDPEGEACRIVIRRRAFDAPLEVAAPMKHKELCYDMIKDAEKVIARSGAHCFQSIIVKEAMLVLVLRMSGRVDVAAPMPNRELSQAILQQAKIIIERYGDSEVEQFGAHDSRPKLDA